LAFIQNPLLWRALRGAQQRSAAHRGAQSDEFDKTNPMQVAKPFGPMVCVLFCALAVAFAAASANAAEARNLLNNPGLEEVAAQGQPKAWGPFVVSVPGTFTSDQTIKHSGNRSLRIDAPENTRLYLRSDPIPVAPGEKISASAWVKCKDVPVGKGTIILIGEFTNSHDTNPSIEKFAVLDRKDQTDVDWQKIEGSITVPALAANLRLRMGFSYSQGTVWWDDVSVTSELPLVVSADLPQPRLSPASGTVPVRIINREASHDRVHLMAMLGVLSSTMRVDLSGELQQRVDVPLRITKRGPKQSLSVSIQPADKSKILFTEERPVVVPPPLTMQPISPTHWCIEDGHATIDGMLDVALEQKQMESATAKLAVVDANGKTVLERTRDKALVDGHNAFQLVLPDLPIGSYRIVSTIKPQDGEEVRGEQDWQIIPRRLAEVTINSDGYCVYDGKPIFGIGIYNGGAHVKEMGESGFTVNHAYNAVNVEIGEPPNDVGAKQFMDSTQANGMKAMFLIPRGLVFHGDWDGFRRRIRMFKNHPALLCWDEEEGLARGDMKMDALVKMRQIIREEDPHHPIMIGDMKDVGTRLPDRSDIFPIEQMDMGQWWWYPLPLKERNDTGLELEGDKFGNGGELVPPAFLTSHKTSKPIWVGIQAYKKGDKSRYPTAIEYRAQAYLSIIHGAKGVMWYGGSVTGGIYLNLEEGHWDDLKKLAGELHEMSPVFMAKDLDAPSVEPKDALIGTAIKRDGDRVVLLACNRSTRAVDVTMRSKEIQNGDVEVLFEKRSLKPQSEVLKDHFEPLDVHVYQIHP
jgi:hypothetical protein